MGMVYGVWVGYGVWCMGMVQVGCPDFLSEPWGELISIYRSDLKKIARKLTPNFEKFDLNIHQC